MENVLRFVIVFLWCVCFGFFSVMGYLDDSMVTSPILAGLMAALVVYCAIEWRPKIKGLASIPLNLPTWGSIKKRFLTTNKPSVSSKSLP